MSAVVRLGEYQEPTGKLGSDAAVDMECEIERLVLERTKHLVSSNAELEMFNYSLSHDLRAPLRCIEGYADMLSSELHTADASDVQQTCVAQIINSVRNAQALVDGMLRLAKFRHASLQVAEVDVNAMVTDVLNDLELHRPSHLEVTMGQLPSCQGDGLLLRQVFVNLISNAYKFSAKVRRPVVHIGFQKNIEGSYYYVRDNGIGFDMSAAPKIFKVFERLPTAENFAGTGVGLAIVAHIIKRHSGAIWAQGDVGRGAMFGFSIGTPSSSGAL